MRLPPWMWRVMRSRKTKIFLASSPFVFCLLVLLFYFGTHWWGRSRAQRLLQDYESAGYAVDPEKYWLPAANPQDDLCQDPLFQRQMEDRELAPLGSGYTKMSLLARKRPRPELRLARVTDLARWIDPPAGDDRAAAEFLLKEHAAAVGRLEALRPALSRSKEVRRPAHATTEAVTTPGPVWTLKLAADAAGEIAVLHLAAGDPEKAAGAVVAMLDIARLELDPKPTLIPVIMTDILLRRTQSVICEGVIRGGWSDAYLQAFETSLAALQPQQAAVKSHLGDIALLRGETKRALADRRALPDVEVHWPAGGRWDASAIWGVVKTTARQLRSPGLALAKQTESQREFLDGVARAGGAPRVRFTPQDLAGFRQRDESSDSDPLAFSGGAKGLAFLASAALRMETTIALTRTGIALERYRLRSGNGSYPASLEALVPDFLPEVPVDPFGSGPLRYRLQADGSPHVWSVGDNLTDQGGLPHTDHEEGDLIWITRPIPGFTEKDFRRR